MEMENGNGKIVIYPRVKVSRSCHLLKTIFLQDHLCTKATCKVPKIAKAYLMI